MSTELSYERLNDEMVAAIPALKTAYRGEVDWWEHEPAPSHVLFGEILNPYLSDRLAAGGDDSLAVAFGFLERMAGDIDPRVQDVLRDTVLEHIRDEPSDLRYRATQVMGPATLTHWQHATEDR
jgi:hypothetical protein